MRLILLVFLGVMATVASRPFDGAGTTASVSPCRTADDTSALYNTRFTRKFVVSDSVVRARYGIVTATSPLVLVTDSTTCHLALATYNTFVASFDSAQLKEQIYLFHAAPYYLIPNAPRTTGSIFTVVLDSNFAFISGLESIQ